MVNPYIFQVVGYQNSGKTTVVTQILLRLKQEGIKAVSIKHHGHGGVPEINYQKDSSRHIDSGAIASVVEGGGRLLLQAEKTAWTLQEKIQLMDFFNPDTIIVEGYKREGYPKLLLIRAKEDLELISLVKNTQCILFWDESLKEFFNENIRIPCFQINDKTGMDWIIHFLKKQSGSNVHKID